MQIYLVGGAVRDALLDRPVSERDWVVVGARAEELLAQGFKTVGKDFPVFLHPDTGEEYALARTERKSGRGYHGFVCYTEPEVTLEQDLERRDLTINAIAQTADGQLIDPYGGQQDLQQRWLRHVSPAFAEDPVRILRCARFLARYAPLGFRVAPETLQLMRDMVQAGEVDALVPERVWAELVRALMEPCPAEFFRLLRDCGALARLLPELDALFGVPQPERHHPEIDTGVHTLMALEYAASEGCDAVTRWAVLLHDLGKGTTPQALWPRHLEHEQRGVQLAQAVCERLRVPREFRELAQLTARYHTECHRALELRPSTVLKLLEAFDALRRPQRLQWFLSACRADARGRAGLHDCLYPQADYLQQAADCVRQVDVKALLSRGLAGPALADALRLARLNALSTLARN